MRLLCSGVYVAVRGAAHVWCALSDVGGAVAWGGGPACTRCRCTGVRVAGCGAAEGLRACV
eukprot:scaffold91363_cov56-Phaeocystis_antarctica.AAC.4